MSPVGYLLLLALAIIISAQLLMMMGRRKPLAARLRDLSEGGDSFGLMWIALLLGGALGAAIGSLFNAPGTGATIGLCAGLLSWLIALVRSHKRPRRPARH